MSDPFEVAGRLLARLPDGERMPLVLGEGESPVRLARVDNPTWLEAQIRLRGERWGTDDRRVLSTLWWYSASAWTVGPTLASLAAGEAILSAEVEDLVIHWLPDGRITGATSTRLARVGGSRVETAARTLRGLFEHVLPLLAAQAGMRERPLWAISADALAGRLLWLERAWPGDAAPLLEPLTEAIGAPLPRPRYTGTGPDAATRRCSCCLLYRAPEQRMCGACPGRPR